MSNILTRLRHRRTKPNTEAAATETPTEARGPRTRFGAWLGRPMTSFHLIIAVTALLVTLGLTMVLSASGVHSYDEDGSPWVIFGKQLIWTLVGLFAFYAAMRMRVQTMRNLGVDPEKVNVNGGAIALGHPLGATGAMILGTAVDELERRGLGTALITLCIGGGQAVATIIERV